MSAASFYRCAVTHERFGQVLHRLTYRVAYVLVDLDVLNEGRSPTRLFGFNRPRPLSILARDHGDGETDDLAQWVRRHLLSNGVLEEGATITLLTLPRVFGFVFNPASFYFIHDRQGALHHIPCEVNNTFGERHFYLLRANREDCSVRQSCDKEFYVSPFLEMAGRYFFKIRPPKERVSIGIDYRRDDGVRELAAYMAGDKAPLNLLTSLKVLLEFPLMTLGVVAAIHWEALLLFFKGATFHANPRSRRFSSRKFASRKAE